MMAVENQLEQLLKLLIFKVGPCTKWALEITYYSAMLQRSKHGPPAAKKGGPDCLYLMGNNQHHHFALLLLGTWSRNNMWHDALEMFGPFCNTVQVWHICKHDKERARSRKDKLTRAQVAHIWHHKMAKYWGGDKNWGSTEDHHRFICHDYRQCITIDSECRARGLLLLRKWLTKWHYFCQTVTSKIIQMLCYKWQIWPYCKLGSSPYCCASVCA